MSCHDPVKVRIFFLHMKFVEIFGFLMLYFELRTLKRQREWEDRSNHEHGMGLLCRPF